MKDFYCHLRNMGVHLPIILIVLTAVCLYDTAATAIYTPPPQPIRIPAEFEPMQAVVILGNHVIPDSTSMMPFVSYVTEHVNLIVICRTKEITHQVREVFQLHNIDLDRCLMLADPYESSTRTIPAARDQIPWFMFTDHNQPSFVYNQKSEESWTQMFNTPPYGPAQGYPTYISGLWVDGGNFMTDGQGTAVSLDRIYGHPANQALLDELPQRIKNYWGVETYYIFPSIHPNEVYHPHIDCLAKFLSPDTIMVLSHPKSSKRYQSAENAAAYFSRQISCYGTPYHVTRVDTGYHMPYINSLIVNDRVYVPIMNSEDELNAKALATYEAAMPGYQVIGVPGIIRGHDFWFPQYALHCRTMGIADEQMLYIEHTPVLDRPTTAEGFPIHAKIVAHSDQPFIEETPAVLWRHADTNGWNRIKMTASEESNDKLFTAMIPSHPVGTTIQYYLHAEDASGRSENHPYIGAPQAHTFTVKSFGANVSAVSVAKGGTINLYINTGFDNRLRDYAITYSLDINDPNEATPICQESLADDPTTIGSVKLPSTTVFTEFHGIFDDTGFCEAQLVLPDSLPCHWVGGHLRLYLILNQSPNTILDTVSIRFLE